MQKVDAAVRSDLSIQRRRRGAAEPPERADAVIDIEPLPEFVAERLGLVDEFAHALHRLRCPHPS